MLAESMLSSKTERWSDKTDRALRVVAGFTKRTADAKPTFRMHENDKAKAISMTAFFDSDWRAPRGQTGVLIDGT